MSCFRYLTSTSVWVRERANTIVCRLPFRNPPAIRRVSPIAERRIPSSGFTTGGL